MADSFEKKAGTPFFGNSGFKSLGIIRYAFLIKLLNFFHRDSLGLAYLYTAFTAKALLSIHRISLAINHLKNIHRAYFHAFLIAIALIFIHSYFPHALNTSLCFLN
jgi:hypothetical protein